MEGVKNAKIIRGKLKKLTWERRAGAEGDKEKEEQEEQEKQEDGQEERRRGGEEERRGEEEERRGGEEESLKRGQKAKIYWEKDKNSPVSQKCENWRGGAEGERRREEGGGGEGEGGDESLKRVKKQKYMKKEIEKLTR